VARKIGVLDYAIYVHRSCRRGREKLLPWITYEDGMAALPQARWIAAATVRGAVAVAPLAVNDAEAIFQAVRAGPGKSLLPRGIADRERDLRRWDVTTLPPRRELWLLSIPTSVGSRALPRLSRC
jgi:DNA-binding transcriptional LysR family regulator